MNVAVFGIMAFLAILLDTTLLHALRLDFGPLVSIVPSFTAALVVFIAMFAPRAQALWAAWGLGMLLDLCTADALASVQVLGPHTLGAVLACYMVMLIRPMVFRRRTLTVATLTVAGSYVMHLMVIAVFMVRSWSPEWANAWTELSPGAELARRFLMAAYSGVIAVPLGWLLLATIGLWRFQTAGSRSGGAPAWRP